MGAFIIVIFQYVGTIQFSENSVLSTLVSHKRPNAMPYEYMCNILNHCLYPLSPKGNVQCLSMYCYSQIMQLTILFFQNSFLGYHSQNITSETENIFKALV